MLSADSSVVCRAELRRQAIARGDSSMAGLLFAAVAVVLRLKGPTYRRLLSKRQKNIPKKRLE
jgi:hypothetical protein